MELKLISPIFFVQTYILLIVPYGIETITRYRADWSAWLLIVPYGIETLKEDLMSSVSMPSNRTLWN